MKREEPLKVVLIDKIRVDFGEDTACSNYSHHSMRLDQNRILTFFSKKNELSFI